MYAAGARLPGLARELLRMKTIVVEEDKNGVYGACLDIYGDV